MEAAHEKKLPATSFFILVYQSALEMAKTLTALLDKAFTETLYTCITMPLDRNFSFIVGVARLQTKCSSSEAKRAIGLKLGDRLALGQSLVCDQICKNPACRENAQVAQCALLVPQVKNCQNPVFVIFTSNLSTNLWRRLWRVNVSYQGEISLHFDLPSLYSCRTRSPLLRALIRIPARGLSRHS